jgi:hypothetical protein
MDYYLETYLDRLDWWGANERFGLDYAMYVSPAYEYDERDLAAWEIERTDLGLDRSGNRRWAETIRTPKGELHRITACNEITDWTTEYLIKLERIVQKTLRVTEMWQGTPADMVETGGGAGSSTVISPTLFEEFCLPYDKRQNEAFHAAGVKVVYHLCGGLMPMLDLVVESGADGLETMTPPGMGGDCDLREASRRVGGKLFFIGGFDQLAGFERGTPERARQQVFDCFEATRDHAGYIVCPSDHFFHGDPACIEAFADAAKECVY